MQLRGNARILNDKGVCSPAVRLTRIFQRLSDFVRQNDGVEGQIHPHTAQMRVVAGFLEGLHGEVVSPTPGVELVQPKVHRIRTRVDRGMQGGGTARRGKKLDVFSHPFPLLY